MSVPAAHGELQAERMAQRIKDIEKALTPTGDPAFDAGQRASAEDMIEADRTQPGELNDLMSNPPPIQPDLFQDQQATEVGQLRTPEQNRQILEDQAKAQIEVQKQMEEGFQNIEQVSQRTKEAEKLASEGSIMADALRKSGAIEGITPTQTQTTAPTETTTEVTPEPVQQQIQFPETPDQKQVESVVGKVEETARKKKASEKKTAATRRTTERNKFIAQTVAQKMENGATREEAIRDTAAIDLPAWDKANPVTKFTKTEEPKTKKSKNKKTEAPIDLGQVNFEDLRKGVAPQKPGPKFAMRDPAEAEMQAYMNDQSDVGEEISVVGEEDAGPFVNNASGESAASAEAISRLNDEKSKGMMRAVLKPTGEVVPLVTAADVDHVPQKGEMIVQRQQDGSWGILDSGTVPKTLAQARINSNNNTLTATAQDMGYIPSNRASNAVNPEDIDVYEIQGLGKWVVSVKDRNLGRRHTYFDTREEAEAHATKLGSKSFTSKETAPKTTGPVSDALRSGSSQSVKSLLEKARDSVDTDLQKKLITRLLSLDLKIPVEVSNSISPPLFGLYRWSGKGFSGKIEISDRILNDEKKTARTVVHELTHAATLEILNKKDDFLTPAQRKAKAEIIDLYHRVGTHPSLKGQYGLYDVAEFIAEAWSNKEFQDLLQNIKVDGERTYWNQFVSSIRKLLGLSPDQHTALSEAIRITDSVIKSQTSKLSGKFTPHTYDRALTTDPESLVDERPRPLMAQKGRSPRRGKLPLITKPDGNTEISDHIKSGTASVKTLLEKVKANVDSKFHGELIDKLSSLGLDSKISISTIENAPDDVKAAHAKGENPAAWYQDGEITFLDTALNDNEGDVAWYAVHETTHAATEEVINKPDKVLTHSQRSAKKQLMSLYERVKKHESVKGQYGLTDISEFMAEAWSNKEFQDLLRNIKIGGVRNVWNQFISGVRQLLGMKPGEHNALSEAIRIGDVIMESQRPADGGAIRPMVSEEALSRPVKKGGVEIDLVNTEKAKQKGVHKKGDTPEGALRKTIESWTRSGGSLNNIVREIVEYGQQGSTEKGIVARNIGREIQSYLNKNDKDGTLREALTKAVRGREGAISQVNAALADHPELKSIVDEAIRTIKLNAIDILEQSYKHGIKIPDHIARKILKSATDADYLYVTRNFMKDDPKGGGKRYSEGMARAAGIESGLDQQIRRKLDNLAEKLATKGSLGKAFFGKKAERIKDYRRRVLNAMQYFMTNDLYIPDADGLGEMKTKSLDRLHHTYFGDFLDGHTADSLKAIYPNETDKKRKSRARKLNRQRKIEDLLGARERQETEGDWKEKELYPRAERLVKDILGLTDQETASQLAKYYGAGERADLTIVTERKSIPKPVLELMGEHEDAAYNLFSTLNRQAEFISRQRMMQEMLKLEGTHVFKEQDANPIIHTETLNGPTFGPLQGMRVTPEVKSYLDAKLEATETFGKILKDISEGKTSNYGQRLYGALASSFVRPITRLGKFVSVATNVAGIALNVGGSPLLLASDGNFSPTTWIKGVKTASQLINLVDKKATTDEVLEVFRLGIGDSVQVGELSNAELLATLGRLSPNNILLKGKNTVVDLFSVSDAWTKISNYYHQVNILTKVYDQAGIDIDPEQIRRNAAERVKRTNPSYFRAPLLAKVPEATGLVWFTTYLWEVHRSFLGSAAYIATDIQRVRSLREQGATEAADTLQSHVIQRAIGLSIAGPAMTTLLGTAVNYAASVAWGDDDDEGDSEEERKRKREKREKEDFIAKQALYDDQVGATPMIIHRGENGERIVFDMSRFDPRGPVNEMARGLGRAAMSGDIESLFSTAKGAVIENTYLPELMKVGAYMLGASDPRSRGPSNIQNNYPEAWDAMKGFAINNGMDPKGVNEIGRGAFKLAPRTIGTAVGAVVNESLGEDGNNAPGFVNFLAGMGFNLQHYSPADSITREARFNYTGQTRKSRDSLHEYSKLPSSSIEGDRLEEMTLNLLNTEFDNWTSLRDKVVAAEYAGRTKAEIFKDLTNAGIDKSTARTLLRGEFIFRGVTVDMVKSWRKEALDDAKAVGNRDEFNDIVEKYKLLGPSLINITNKYRKEFYHKEGGVK